MYIYPFPTNSHDFYNHPKYDGGGILIKMVPNFIILGKGIIFDFG